MFYRLSTVAAVFVFRLAATGVADAMIQTEYDTSFPAPHPFARMAMCQKASTCVQNPTLSYVLVFQVVAVVACAPVPSHDIDTVILLPQNCTQQRAQAYAPPLEVEHITREPE